MRRIGLIAIAAAVVLPLSAIAQTSGYYERSYTRMSYVQGDVYVQRAQDLGYEQGQVNLVVVEGDKLGTRSGRLEIQLGLRNYLRLDNDTQVEMAALPDRDGLPTKLHIAAGGVYLRVSTLDVEKGYEIHTPDASFYVLREGLYRVDVRPSRETDFSVYEGAAEAAGQEGSIVIEERQRVSASDGRFVSEPFSLIARRDDFSTWNDTREALFARASSQSSSYLPAEYSDYGYELDSYGSWVNEADYGSVWVPRGLDSAWQPYSYGRWVWYPIIGWTWVSYDSWGWCTHHYGRWGWRLGLGWYWIPRNHWSWGPAWVNWWYDGDYIGWCALSYYNRPAVIINNFFYDRHNRNDFRSFGRTLNVVRRDQLQDRNLRSVAVGADRFANRGEGITFRNGLTDVRPSGRGDATVNARAAEVLSGRNARPVEGGYAANGRRLSAGEIRSSGIRGETISGSGSRVVRDGAAARSEEPSRAVTGRTQNTGAGIVPRPGSAGRAGAGEARTIQSYPSQGDRGVSSGTVRRNDGGAESSVTGRPGVSSGTVRSRETGSGSASGTSAGSTSRRSGDDSSRVIRAYPSGGAASRSTGVTSRSSAGSTPSSSRAAGSSMREYPSGSASRSSGAASSGAARSSSRSTVSSREYPSSSTARSSTAPRSSSSSSSRSTVSPRAYPSSSSARSSSSSSSARQSIAPRSSSSSSSSRMSSAPSSRASSPSRISSAPSRSSSSSSRISSAPRASASSSSSRSYSAPSPRASSSSSSRSYSAPARSSSSSSRVSSAPRASSSPSRSYSAPSRSSSSSSPARVSSRSSSGGSASRSSGSSARSSGSSSSRASSGSSRRR